MTIVFAGGEFGSFTSNDANTYESTTSGTFDSTFARCGLASVGSTSYAQTADWSSALTTGWLHYNMHHAVLTPTTWVSNVNLDGSSGSCQLEYFNNQVRFRYYNGSGYSVAFTVGITETALCTIDIYFRVNTASGEINLYSGGSLLGASGTIDLSAVANLRRASFIGGQGGATNTVSEVIVADESTIGWRLGTLAITGAGATNTFTSGTYADVDEIVHSDVDALISDTANQVFLGACNDLAPTASLVKALIVTARAKTSGAAPTKADLAVRSNSTTYLSTPDSTLTVGFAPYLYVWEDDPGAAPGTPWDATTVAAAQIGAKSIA